MAGMDVFNIVVGVLGIISFVFSIWIWMKSDMKIRELSGIIDAIHDISRTAIWEYQTTIKEVPEAKLQQADKTIGFMSSIRKLTERYIKQISRINENSPFSQLVEQGII